jgi:hypothetical protein
MDVKTALRILVRSIIQNEELYSVVCTVDQVDEDKRLVDVTPIDGSAPITGVRLQVDESMDSGVVIIPKANSRVTVAFLNKNAGYVSQYSDIEKILFKVGSSSGEISDDGVILNGGDNGGLINISDLVQKLNTIEQDLNAIKMAFTTWTPIPSDGGAALKTAAASWYSQQLQQTSVQEIEDNKVQH